MTVQNIAQLIANVESNNDQYALRYEPLYKPGFLRATDYAKRHRVTLRTAEVCLSCSWGLYQIMGDNLYSYGLQVSLPEYVSSLQMQNKYFNVFLAQNGLVNLTSDFQSFISDDTKLAAFARVYNGPDNVDAYVSRMKEVYYGNV